MYKIVVLLTIFLFSCHKEINYNEHIIPIYPLDISEMDTTYFKLNSVYSDTGFVEYISFKYFNGREYKIVDIRYSDVLLFGTNQNNPRILVGYNSPERYNIIDIFDKLKHNDNKVIYELIINYKYLD